MRIAIPVEDGRLSQHFGHAGSFVFIEADESQGRILSMQELPAPPHEPGRLPAWLKEQGTDAVIAGGMGPRAVALLEACAIQVVAGAPSLDPRTLVEQWLAGALAGGPNRCSHGGHGGHGGACRH
ncbi:MAG: NifB/NifX family molybdenum-iron cluster-binding protein [Bryobacteraceae bacterium]